MLYTNELGELENRPIRFTIDGKEWTDDQLLVAIPHRYADWFDGASFKSRTVFNRALMFASCAAEAVYYGRDWLVERDEAELKRCFDTRKRKWGDG